MAAADDDIEWKYSPVREFLSEAFDDGRIPLEYSSTIGPSKVYDMTKDEPEMKDVKHNETFKRRLLALSKEVVGTVDRANNDEEAFLNFIANHPRPTHNYKGEPRWEGSVVERFLKQDLANGRHVGLFPHQFRMLRPCYQEYELQTIRAHVDQEKRLWNYHNCLEDEEAKEQLKI